MHQKKEWKTLPDWAKRSVFVTWLRLDPSADFSTFLITTSPAPTPARPFCARSSLCCRSSCRRVSRSFSLWSVEEERKEEEGKRWRGGREGEEMMSVEKRGGGGQEVLNKLPAPQLTATKMESFIFKGIHYSILSKAQLKSSEHTNTCGWEAHCWAEAVK